MACACAQRLSGSDVDGVVAKSVSLLVGPGAMLPGTISLQRCKGGEEEGGHGLSFHSYRLLPA